MTPRGSFYRHAGGGGKPLRRIGSGVLDAIVEAERRKLACARGEHDRRTAPLSYVTYGPFGRGPYTPGTDYCAICGDVLPPGSEDGAGA